MSFSSKTWTLAHGVQGPVSVRRNFPFVEVRDRRACPILRINLYTGVVLVDWPTIIPQMRYVNILNRFFELAHCPRYVARVTPTSVVIEDKIKRTTTRIGSARPGSRIALPVKSVIHILMNSVHHSSLQSWPERHQAALEEARG